MPTPPAIIVARTVEEPPGNDRSAAGAPVGNASCHGDSEVSKSELFAEEAKRPAVGSAPQHSDDEHSDSDLLAACYAVEAKNAQSSLADKPADICKPAPKVNTKRLAAMLLPQCKNELVKPASALEPGSWLHDAHIDVLLARAFLQAWDATGNPPAATYLGATEVALLGSNDLTKANVIIQAASFKSEGTFDWSKHSLVCIPLNSPGAGGTDSVCEFFFATLFSLVLRSAKKWFSKKTRWASFCFHSFVRCLVSHALMRSRTYVFIGLRSQSVFVSFMNSLSAYMSNCSSVEQKQNLFLPGAGSPPNSSALQLNMYMSFLM